MVALRMMNYTAIQNNIFGTFILRIFFKGLTTCLFVYVYMHLFTFDSFVAIVLHVIAKAVRYRKTPTAHLSTKEREVYKSTIRHN